MKTKQKILTTAQRLFIDLGYEKTNLRLLAKESGLTTGAIYGYFSSKKEILLELATPAIEEMIAIYEKGYKMFKAYSFEDKVKFFSTDSGYPFGNSKAFEVFYSHYDVWVMLNKFNNWEMFNEFNERFLAVQVDGAIDFFKELKEHDMVDEVPSREFIMLIIDSFVSGQFKILKMPLTQEEQGRLFASKLHFYNEGWKSLLKK